MDIRSDVLGQVQQAFARGREQIYTAMSVVHAVLQSAAKEGLLVLSKDEMFRGKGQPHILDRIEEKEHITVPLKSYLAFALEEITLGNEFEILEERLANKYFVNAYTGKEALIAYLYSLGTMCIAKGKPFAHVLEYYRSLVPEAEEERFDAFALQNEKDPCFAALRS